MHCAGNKSTTEVFNDSLENSLRDSSFELNEKDLVSQDFTCDSQVDFSVNNERQVRFTVSECFGRKQTESGWYKEDAKNPMVNVSSFFLGSRDVTKLSPPNLNLLKCDLATQQPALWSRETSFVNSEEVKLYETQKSSLKNLPHEFKVPQCLNIDSPTVEKKGPSLVFEIKCGKSQPGTSLSPAKLIDKAKRKTMILSNRKLQSTELREKLLSTSSCINERVKVKTPHRKLDKERRASKFLPKRLTLTKVKAADRVYQRNPFATLNVYYDQYWMEKQEMAFTNWLNFILTPNDDFQSSEEIQVNSTEIWMESMKDAAPIHAPSKEELSFKTYTAAKQLNRLRKSACQLYQSEELSQTIKRIEKEVDLKKLCIRSDRAINADLGIKKEMLEMLLSYNPLWLRIGLETVYGEMISLMNNRDIVGLSRFIINRFLSNPELVAKYAHSSVINYYKPGFEENMKSFTLKKFLLLVYFLDVAKRKYLIDHNPCLFSKKSKYKSSRDLLITFSREYLSGEGDVTKHLRYLGCVVKHQQAPIEEFDYAVKNIAVDLRCGLRLGRAVELLLQDWSISKTLRANTLNRLAKIHNNDFIFKALQKAGLEIEGNIDPRDIVDGNREKTLSLLWQIIFKTQISLKVNLEALKKENSYLRRSLKLKADCAAFNAIYASEDKADNFEYDFFNSKLYKENEVIQQLFQWCQNVCAHYGVKVHNFTSSFSDGRALCYLLHHYHPNLLPVNLIKTKTTSSYFEEEMENLEDENCPFLPEERQMKSKVLGDCLKNERWNLDIVLQKAQEIGQIPSLSFPTDMSNTLPDEKVVITLVSYINIRLMELSVEIRAARTILYAYRKWRLRRRQKELQVKITAAMVIQRYWRNYKERLMIQLKEKSAITIQRTWRMYSAKKQLETLKKARYLNMLNDKATIIQAAFKGYKARKRFLMCIKSAVIMQSHVRKWLARTRFLKLKSLVVKVQSVYRARVLGKIQRAKFLLLKKSVVHLQAFIRGMHLRKKLASQTSAVIVLQSYTRMWLARKNYLKLKKACLFIQERFRLLLLVREQVESFQKTRQSAIIIQRWYLAIRKTRLEHKSAVKIQCWFRQVMVRKIYMRCRSCIITIQLWWKAVFIARNTRSQYLQDRRRVILLQACFRKLIAKRAYETKRMSAIVIQKYVRKTIEFKRFCKVKESAITIQRWWRNMLFSCQVRNEYLVCRSSVIKVQSLWRMYSLRKAFERQKQATLIIERYRIGKVQRKAFLSIRGQCIAIQSSFRGYICRKKYNTVRNAVISIQRFFKSYLVRKRFMEKKNSAIKIQQYYRSYQQMCRDRQNYATMRSGFTRLQAVYRGVRERREINFLHGRAFLIQKCYRRYIARKQYLELKRACSVVQRRYKANILMKTQVQKYNAVKNAAISLQRFFRSYLVRKRYLEKKNSAIKIQKYYRNHKQMCKDRQNYMTMKSGFTRLQAVYRGVKERQEINFLHGRACLIQKSYRRYIARKQYLGLKRACSIVQRRYRANILMKTQVQQYNKTIKSIILIQATLKCIYFRRLFLEKKNAAIKIQSYVRMMIARKSYINSYRKIVFIQQVYRAKQARYFQMNMYCETRQRIIFLQSKVRCFIARKNYLKIKSACILVQSVARMWLLKTRYARLRNAAIIIQTRYRSLKIARKTRKEYLDLKIAAVKVQSAYRRNKEVKKFKKVLDSALIIQGRVKALLAGRKARQHYLFQRKSVIIVQSFIRMAIARRNFLNMHYACVTIQSYYRMWSAQKSYLKAKKAVSVLQKHFHAWKIGKEKREQFLEMKRSATLIQACYRGYVLKRKYDLKRKACITIQAHARRFIAQKCFSRQKRAALVLQNSFRALLLGKETRKQYESEKNKIILLQAVVKGWLARRRIQRLHHSALKIQKTYKSYICRKNFLIKKRSAVMIQRSYKSYIRKSVHLLFLKLTASSTIIQSAWRQYRTQCEFKRKRSGAILLQSQVRKMLARKQYLRTQQSVVTIQRRYRAYRLGSEQFQLYRLQRRSCITIQSVWRSYRVRTEYKKKMRAVVLLQSHVRKVLLRRKYVALQHSAILIQRYYLAFKAGRQELHSYQQKRKSCIKIQAAWRGFLIRRQLTRQVNAVVCIQKYLRKWMQRKREQESLGLESKQQHKWYLHFHANLVTFQIHARQHLQRRERSALLIQSYYRMWLAQRKFRKLKAIVTIQAFWRGYKVRKTITDSRILEFRQKLKTSHPTKNILRNRTTRALEILITNKNLRAILIALQDLDVCTQLSPTCCERLEQSEGLSIIIDLVRSCNRSIPHKELIKVSTNILLNIAKYRKTVNSIWADPKTLVTILDLMKIYRETGQDIFTKCCTLFYIFCHDPEKTRALKNNSYFCEQIKSSFNLLMRKLNIEEKRSKSSVPTTQAFIKRWISSNSRESLPIDPDWLLGHHRKRSFKDPYTAISALMQALELHPKSVVM